MMNLFNKVIIKKILDLKMRFPQTQETKLRIQKLQQQVEDVRV